ncbi:LuxR family transcriptional regulator [Bacteroides pyogenes]|uniref:LuxR family transcriptional regulator n=2 Tax=Bacteroides pyogenes TaxID=310300 RepID=A0A5D3E9C0_9BACE|nr:LuxR family transcriptional regulator [Bacteroides pyogenes]
MNMSPRVLTKRQKQFVECIAWGASYKEVADYFHVSWSTVDNTLRNAKSRLGLSKVTELGAWWFCANFGISFDLSPLARRHITSLLLCLFLSGEAAFSSDKVYAVRRVRRARTEYRTRRQESSTNKPYIF